MPAKTRLAVAANTTVHLRLNYGRRSKRAGPTQRTTRRPGARHDDNESHGRRLALAGELGLTANVSPSSASGHLAKLVSSRILTDSRQGRHKYYRIATAAVAHAIEALQIVASPGTVLRQVGQSTLNPFAFARTCYDHLAGRLGVEVTAALQRQKALRLAGKGYELTDRGCDWLQEFGIDWQELQLERRQFALQCLDFTERRPHLSGALGAALLARMIELDWIRKTRVPPVRPSHLQR